jgi:hypothetical protein
MRFAAIIAVEALAAQSDYEGQLMRVFQVDYLEGLRSRVSVQRALKDLMGQAFEH